LGADSREECHARLTSLCFHDMVRAQALHLKLGLRAGMVARIRDGKMSGYSALVPKSRSQMGDRSRGRCQLRLVSMRYVQRTEGEM
jgi:hypothetical protein